MYTDFQQIVKIPDLKNVIMDGSVKCNRPTDALERKNFDQGFANILR